jgi:putative endonuclease
VTIRTVQEATVPRSDWQVYIVECADGSLYTGIARDVPKRVARHNEGAGARYARSRLPVVLVYAERVADRSSALRREYQIKRLSAAAKRQLIASAAHPVTPA